MTAFPLEGELDALTWWFGAEQIAAAGGVLAPAAAWVLRVREALHVTNTSYLFIAYGTD